MAGPASRATDVVCAGQLRGRRVCRYKPEESARCAGFGCFARRCKRVQGLSVRLRWILVVGLQNLERVRRLGVALDQETRCGVEEAPRPLVTLRSAR